MTRLLGRPTKQAHSTRRYAYFATCTEDVVHGLHGNVPCSTGMADGITTTYTTMIAQPVSWIALKALISEAGRSLSSSPPLWHARLFCQLKWSVMVLDMSGDNPE